VGHYRRLEDDRDRTQAARGSYPIRRIPAAEWPAYVTRLQRAAAARGLRHIPDINENPVDGFFAMPVSQDTDRASSARCYLTAAVRRRGNLAIMARTRVTGLRCEDRSVRAVTIERAGRIEQLSAREVILCAGAVHSPAMLLRAGIGPAGELTHHGIALVVDRPGVGRNLQNHPYLHFALTLPRGWRLAGHLRCFAIAGIRHSSGLPGCPTGDLLMFMIGRVSPRSHGTDLAMVGAALYSPFSRGKVTLAHPDFDVPPRIDFRMLADPRDPPRLLEAARFAEGLLLDPAVAAAYSEAFLLPPVMSLHQFNRPGLPGAADSS
jgi:5-(hydroxymethyl)furfural/furfural oxidase